MPTVDIKRASHIVLTVKDLAASKAFYQNILGLEQKFDMDLPGNVGKSAGLLVAPDLMIELICIDGITPQATSTGPTLAFTIDDVDATRAVLASENVTIANEMTVHGIEMLFIKDPDGHTIELAQFPNGVNCSAELQSFGT